MNVYELSRSFWDFSFENPDKVRPNHIALYFFSVEHCNRLGWKKKFGLPTSMAMEAIGVKSYNTYIATFKDLVEWGFFNLVEKSRNQYSSNIIELSKIDKANDKALDKALIKHATKQSESTQQSIDSIDKQYTSKPINNNNRSVIVDANINIKEYRKYFYDLVKEREISRDKLFMQNKIDLSKRNELWESFIDNSIIHVPQIFTDDHAWNTFKKYIRDNITEWQFKNKSNFEGF